MQSKKEGVKDEEIKKEEIKEEEIKISMTQSVHLELEEASVEEETGVKWEEEDMAIHNRILACDICAEESEDYRMVKLFVCHHLFC